MAWPAPWRRWPSQCAVCHGWGNGRICSHCTTRFAAPVDRCRRCAARVVSEVAICGRCVLTPPSFQSAIAAVDYSHPWDGIISDFKYRSGLDLADALCDLLLAAQWAHAGDQPDYLLPVPLGAQRLRERGYNQSWELARRCARRLGCHTDAAMLLRIRETPYQLSLPRERRIANVRGAFAIEPKRRPEVVGRRIGLIDDVMTTQATTDELSQVLLDAGALSVQVWVVARTPAPEH